MADGALKIINAMKKIEQSNRPANNEIVTLTVTKKNPLTFQLENRLTITQDFYELSKMERWTDLKVGDKVRGFKFNNSQKYYINENISGGFKHNSAQTEEDVEHLQEDYESLAKRVSNLENIVANLQNQIGG